MYFCRRERSSESAGELDGTDVWDGSGAAVGNEIGGAMLGCTGADVIDEAGDENAVRGWSVRRKPHESQNLAFSGSSRRHWGQSAARNVPHSLQKRAPSRFWVPQTGHCMVCIVADYGETTEDESTWIAKD